MILRLRRRIAGPGFGLRRSGPVLVVWSLYVGPAFSLRRARNILVHRSLVIVIAAAILAALVVIRLPLVHLPLVRWPLARVLLNIRLSRFSAETWSIVLVPIRWPSDGPFFPGVVALRSLIPWTRRTRHTSALGGIGVAGVSVCAGIWRGNASGPTLHILGRILRPELALGLGIEQQAGVASQRSLASLKWNRARRRCGAGYDCTRKGALRRKRSSASGVYTQNAVA